MDIFSYRLLVFFNSNNKNNFYFLLLFFSEGIDIRRNNKANIKLFWFLDITAF